MTHIKVIKNLNDDPEEGHDKDIAVSKLYDGAFREIVEIRLRQNAVLSRHHANMPITVYCVSGNGMFMAGADLDESLDLRAGTLITLEAGVEHEVIADPELHILVMKFKDS